LTDGARAGAVSRHRPQGAAAGISRIACPLLGEADRRHLARAVELGRGGWGRVHPNPMVGALVVAGGKVLAEARHEEFGESHAEVLALAAAGDARGATVYASLEPCAHSGKTPPCTESLIGAGVARVVFWAAEPGIREGGGATRLRDAGVRTDGPFGEPADWARENPFFFHRRRRPFVALKLAVSADGCIAPRGGRRVWLTGSAARREAHRIRAGFDAILVGTRTWKADDPKLTVRGPVTPRIPPARVLLDRNAELGLDARALDGNGGPALVAVSQERAASAQARLGARAEVLPLPLTDASSPACPQAANAFPTPTLDLVALLATLRKRGIERVLCEGGGTLGASLIAQGQVDRLYLFFSPRTVGADGAPAFPAVYEAGTPPAELAKHVPSLAAGTSAEPPPAPPGWRISAAPAHLENDLLIVLDKVD